MRAVLHMVIMMSYVFVEVMLRCSCGAAVVLGALDYGVANRWQKHCYAMTYDQYCLL
jgi:hypothetical protein